MQPRCRFEARGAVRPTRWSAVDTTAMGQRRPRPAAMARASYAAEMTRPPPDAARQRAVQERPTAYAESPRPLRHQGPTDRSAACPPGDRNVAHMEERLSRGRG